MTDGGSINLRMSLKGAEQIRAQLASIGPEGAKLGRELDRAMRQPTAGMRALDSGVSQARAGVEGFTGRLGPLGAGLTSVGALGLATAASLAALAAGIAFAMKEARGAMLLGAELTDTAEKLHVSTDALQEWRHVAIETGADAAAADRAIADFTKRLGEATSGLSPRAMKPFEALGFSRDDLRQFDSVEDALAEVARRVANLGDEAEKAAVTDKLGLEPLQNALRRGGDEIARLREEAHALGVVMDAELIRRADEADAKFDQLSRVIDIQLKSAFVDLAPVIVEAIKLVADFAVALASAMDAWRRLDERTSRGLDRQLAALREENAQLLAQHGSVEAMRGRSARTGSAPAGSSGGAAGAGGALFMQGMGSDDYERYVANQRLAMQIEGQIAKRHSQDAAPPSSGTADLNLPPRSGGGGSRAASDAARQARERERVLEQLNRELANAVRARTGQGDGADTPEARAKIARDLLALDQQERDAKITAMRAEFERLGVLDEAKALAFERLAGLNAEVDAAKAAEIADKERRELEDQARERAEALARAEDQHLRLTEEMLALASAGARTSVERRDIEMRLLGIAQARMRAELEAQIAAEKDAAARARLVEALDRLPALFEAQANAVRRQTAGPLEAWRDSLFTEGSAREFVEFEAVDALDGLNRGLIDALRNASNAGDAFDAMGDVAVGALNRIVDALLEVALQRYLIEPLISSLFGKGQGDNGLLGRFLGGIVGAIFPGASPATGGVSMGRRAVSNTFGTLPRHARGGVRSSASRAIVGEYGMEIVDLPVGARIHDTDRSQRIMGDLDRMLARQSTGAGYGASAAPVVNLRVVNQTREPVQPQLRQSGRDIEVLLEPMVRGAVMRMGADGDLARAGALTPRAKRR